MPSTDEQIAQLQSAIAAQESLRPTLGDTVVEVTLTVLRAQLESLRAEQKAAAQAQPKAGLSPDTLLAQLQSYVPKQLADKMRALGRIEGERRQVTVLFADISGFAAISERLDAEVVASLVNDCLKELVQAVYQYEGMVDKFVGDCVMAVFGAPIALEDDAENALRAALLMREKLQGFNRRWIEKLGQPLDLHIGVNTGIVIAGNMGSDLRMSYTVMGDTVNIAARLQDAAKRGQVFVSRNTYRLTRGGFAFQEMDSIKVKGKQDPLHVYELLHAKLQPEKARGLEGLSSPLVGRDRERQGLAECLDALRRGEGRVVRILGEAGIGKSRLLAEIRQREGKDLTWLEGRSFAFSRSLSYGPFLDLLRRYAGIADEDGEAKARASLRRRLAEIFPEEKDAYPVLAQLLSLRLEVSEAAAVGAMAGEAFRTRLFSIMEEFLLLLARQKPVVVVLEDLHWADLSSMDLVIHLLSVTMRAPVAIVTMGRPKQESAGNWEKLEPALAGFRDRFVELQLQPLSRQSNHDLVKGLLGGSTLPEKLTATIIGKAEGNPFFVEEVLRSLIERGALVRDGAEWKATELVETIQVPDTLQAVLLSRLDRLPEETRRVIQKAAVIGRVFLYRVLDHIARGETGLDAQISRLEEAELVRERARHPEIEYIFQHALTQEVAYQTLLGPARKILHQKVGEAMEAVFAERIEEFTALLAYHYFRGEAWEKALEYSARAGNAMTQIFAYAEARDHFRRALEALKYLPQDEVHHQKRVDLNVRLVSVSPQAESPEKNMALLVEAKATAELLNDPIRLARIQFWMGRVHYLGGRTPEAIGHFQKVLAVASKLGDPELMALPGAVIGRALFMQGQFAKSLELLNQTVPLLEAAKNHHEILYSHIFRAGSRAALGDYATGSKEIMRVLKLLQASRDLNAKTMAHTAFALIQLIAGRYAEAIENAKKAFAIAENSGDAMFQYSSNSFIAWGLSGLKDYEGAIKHWTAAHEAAKKLGGRLLLGEWLAAIEAETLLESGDVTSALKKGEEALAIAKTTGSVIAEALAERAIGRVLAAGSPPRLDEADGHLTKSAALMEEIGAKFDLARTFLAQGRVRNERKDKDGASESLKRALALATECGLQNVETMARELLAAE